MKKLIAALVSALLAIMLSACCCYIPLARLNTESSNYATGYDSHFFESDNSCFSSDDSYYSSNYSYDYGYNYNSETVGSDDSNFEDNISEENGSYYDNNTSEENSSYYDNNTSEDDGNESSEDGYMGDFEFKDEVSQIVGPTPYPPVGPILPFE